MTMIAYPHILLDDKGVAWIDKTNTKVIEVVLDRIAYGMSPEEIHLDYPHISIAQAYAALSYYYDHKEALDTVIAAQEAEFQRLRSANAAADTPGHRKLRAQNLTI
jgi:uncharacterized protein (DUF433 family)